MRSMTPMHVSLMCWNYDCIHSKASTNFPQFSRLQSKSHPEKNVSSRIRVLVPVNVAGHEFVRTPQGHFVCYLFGGWCKAGRLTTVWGEWKREIYLKIRRGVSYHLLYVLWCTVVRWITSTLDSHHATHYASFYQQEVHVLNYYFRTIHLHFAGNHLVMTFLGLKEVSTTASSWLLT